MALNCGIVGLPNVGKSTIFSAITAAPAEAANYPFCTIEPNVGIVNVPDSRMKKICELVGPQKEIPAVVEFVDIAGLVKGASKGEGLGNKFLGNIRQVGAIVHVVRCFEDDDVTHVHETVDPVRDIEIVNIELALSDLQSVEKKLENVDKLIRNNNKSVSEPAKLSKPILEKLAVVLDEGKPARFLELTVDEKELVQDLQLMTMKKVLYACNVDEDSIENENDYVKSVRKYAEENGSEIIVLCGKLEAEISQLDSEEEKEEFMESVGIVESGLSKLKYCSTCCCCNPW